MYLDHNHLVYWLHQTTNALTDSGTKQDKNHNGYRVHPYSCDINILPCIALGTW